VSQFQIPSGQFPMLERYGALAGMLPPDTPAYDTERSMEWAVARDGVEFQIQRAQPDQVGFWEAVKAQMSLNPTKRATSGIANWLSDVWDDSAAAQPEPDPNFDIEQTINRLQPAQRVVANELAADGYLNDITSSRQFYAMLDDAMGVMEDQQVLAAYSEQNPWWSTLGVSALGGVSDPLYMVPVGGQAAGLATTAKAGLQYVAVQGGKNAAMFAGLNLGSKTIVDGTSYQLTNQDGVADEFIVAGMGAGIGVGIPAMAFAGRNMLYGAVTGLSAIRVPLPGSIRARAVNWWGSDKHLRKMMRDMPDAKIDAAVGMSSGGGRDAPAARIGLEPYRVEQANSQQILTNLLDDARNGVFHEQPTLALLRENGGKDALEPLLDDLRQLYAKHRKSLRDSGADDSLYHIGTAEHPGQVDFDRLTQVEKFFTPNAINALYKKSPASLGTLARLVADVADALPTGKTPASRARTAFTRVNDIMRALAASNVESTIGQVEGRTMFRSSAEAIRDGLDGVQRTAVREIESILRKNKLMGMLMVKQDGRVALSEAVNILHDRRLAGTPAAGSVAVTNPSPVANEIADVMDRYFSRMYNELVDVGLLENNPLARGSHYVPLVMDDMKMSGNPEAAKAALVAQFKFNDLLANAGEVRLDALARAWDKGTPEIRSEIEFTAFRHLGSPASWPTKFTSGNQIRELLEDAGVSNLPPVTALGAESRPAYGLALDAIYQDGADDLFRTMTDPFNRQRMFESVQTAANPSALRERTFQYASPELREFLISDPVTLLRRYQSQIHGQVGIAKAIRMHPETFGDLRITRNGQQVPVTNASELLEWLGDVKNGVETLTQKLSSNTPGRAAGYRSAQSAVDNQVLQATAVTKRLIGQLLYEGGARPGEWTMWTSRQLSRMSVLVNGGMMGVSNMMDMTGMVLYSTMRPSKGSRALAQAFAYPFLDGSKPSRRLIDMLHMGSQVTRLLREDLDYVLEQRAAGSTVLGRAATARFDASSEAATQAFSYAIALNPVNNFTRRWAALIDVQDMIEGARKLARGETLSTYQMGRLNQLGVNSKTAGDILEQVHKHGVYSDGTPISATPLNDFIRGDRAANPLFDLWDAPTHDLRRALIDNIGNSARRVRNVSPGVGDRPLIEDTFPLFRLVQQFASFITAYNNQRLRTMAQMENGTFATYAAIQLLTGWLFRATTLDMSNRRSFMDSIRNLQERPHEEIWGAVQQVGMLGSLNRALGYADTFSIGPSRLFGVTSPSGTFGATGRAISDRGMSMPERVASLAGAGPQWIMRFAEGMYEGDTPRGQYLRAQSMPLQNFVWSRLLTKTGVPQAVKESTGGVVPGIKPSDLFRPPRRPALRAR